jgi:LuxR family transcriptional regulator, maltose regulon positive regulatory protein
MSTPILATKLYIPPSRPKVVLRPRLIERLNVGLHRKLTLISAPAGFGKTTLVSEWISNCNQPVVWISLDQGDKDPARFLTYLVIALQMIDANIGKKLLSALQSPRSPAIEPILTSLLNEITSIPNNFILVLDDYHSIDAKPIDHALTLLLERQPSQMHLVITTREDPNLPLARLRVRDQLTELRVADLRFTASEAAEFLNRVMGLTLSTENIAALENRTEGWIAGLQLAAISMQGHPDADSFIESFTGSHHYVMDYLVEEVLGQQPQSIQAFLLRTSILDRLCGSLCEAVLLDESAHGRETLEYLERANLFLIPLDGERRWYRYHHLFADLLRQRLPQSIASSKEDAESRVNELHIRASQWYEDNNLDIEAFHHAAAANDIERAERLIDGKGIPLHLRGAVIAILNWFESLPITVLNARPSLWWRYAALLLINGQTTGVAEKLQAAEATLAATLLGAEPDDKTRNLIGQIAAARATLALTRYDAETMIAQSQRALEYLHLNNLTTRANANWTLGTAYLFQGDRAAARRVLTESISLSQTSGDIFTTILATLSLGIVQEGDNQLHLAAETYQRILQMAGDQPLQIIGEAHLGLARVLYEWNDLDGAEQHGRQSLQLERQYDTVIDRFIICEVFLARLKLAQGDLVGATAILAKADQSARQKNFIYRIPEVVAAQVVTLLHQSNVAVAARLAQAYDLPIVQARVYLAQGDPSAALGVLERWRQQVEAKDWKDEQLKVMVLEAVAYQAQGETDKAIQMLSEALSRAEPEGFIRIFVDEGLAMTQLLTEAAARGISPDYAAKLLTVLESEQQANENKTDVTPAQSLIEPLSQRELEVLQLIAQGLSNHDISERLFLALDTVKGHNRKIFDKLQVQRRTEAVARARALGLL